MDRCKRSWWMLVVVGTLGCAPDPATGTTTRADGAVRPDGDIVQTPDAEVQPDAAVDATLVDAMVDGEVDAANADGGTDTDAASSCAVGRIRDNGSCPSGKEWCASDAVSWECYSCGAARVVNVDNATCRSERRRCTEQGVWECCEGC